MSEERDIQFSPQPNSPSHVFFPERIEVPPFSTEIIADEYGHRDNKDAFVVIFKDSNHKDHSAEIERALCQQGYEIPNSNIFPIDTKDGVLNNIKKIADIDHSNNTAIIVVVQGTIDKEDDHYIAEESKEVILGTEIWRNIMVCNTLLYRPKIFIFHAFKKLDRLGTDAGMTRQIVREKPSDSYSIPVEADMLIVYKRTEDYELRLQDSVYFSNLLKNIKEYGGREELVNIISYTENNNNNFDKRPVIVSTLRKKFFIISSKYRHYWHDIDNEHNQMSEIIGELSNTFKFLQREIETLSKTRSELEKKSTQAQKVKPISKAHSQKIISHVNPGSSGSSEIGGGSLMSNISERKTKYNDIQPKVDSFRKKNPAKIRKT